MTRTWPVVLPGTVAPGLLRAHRRALAALPGRFREPVRTDEGAAPDNRAVGLVSLAVSGWEKRLGHLRGALVTDLALLNPTDVDRLAAFCEAWVDCTSSSLSELKTSLGVLQRLGLPW